MNIRATAVLLVVLGAVAGYFYFVGPSSGDSGPPAPSRTPWFYSAEMDDVEGVVITTSGLRESFVLTESGWLFEGPGRIPVDLARWGGMTLLVSGPQTTRVLDEVEGDLTEYGLSDPAITIGITLQGNRNLEVRLGDVTPNGENHYAMQGTDPGLYLVDSLWGLVLARLALEPPYPQWIYRLDPTLIVYLAVAQGESKVEFTSDASGWRFATTDRDPVDPERWAEVLPFLGGPRSIRILQPEIATDEFQRFGLDSPATTLTVEYKPPETIEGTRRKFDMEFGSKLEDGSGYYAKVVGQPYLLFVDADWYETMERLVLEPPVAIAAGTEGA